MRLKGGKFYKDLSQSELDDTLTYTFSQEEIKTILNKGLSLKLKMSGVNVVVDLVINEIYDGALKFNPIAPSIVGEGVYPLINLTTGEFILYT